MLPSKPYQFNITEEADLQKEFPETMFIRVDGDMFSWYGTRMLQAASYFEKLMKELLKKL